MYGGAGKAARDWASFDAIVATLRRLKDDETLLVQSGKPVGVFQTHEMRAARAHRQRQPGARLGELGRVPPPRRPGPDDVRADDGRQLDLHRHAGHPAGHLPDVRRRRARSTSAPAPTWPAASCSPPASAAWAAPSRWPSPWPAAWRSASRSTRTRIARRLETAYVDVSADSLDEALRLADEARRAKKPLSIGLLGNAADVYPELVRRGVTPDLVTDQTSAHDTLNGYVPNGMSLDEALALRRADPDEYVRRAVASIVVHVQAMIALQRAGAHVFDYGNNIRGVAKEAGYADAFAFPGFVPAYIRPLFCRGNGPFRWAALSAATRPTSPSPTQALLEAFPDNELVTRWLRMAGEKVHFQGLPCRICWLEYGERAKAGLIFNDLVRSGKVKAPHRHRPRPSRLGLRGVARIARRRA